MDEETERELGQRQASWHPNGSAGSTIGLGEWDVGLDDRPIPPRGWLLGNQFCRRTVSALIGAGAAGKTSLRILQYLSLASGQKLSGEHVFRRSRVLVLCLEDDEDELRRRIKAAMLHHGIARSETAGWLFCAAPRGLKLAEMQDGKVEPGPLDALIRNVIERRAIDLVALDPFIKIHSVPGNDNEAIDIVMTMLAAIAIDCDVAVDVTQHTRKGAASPGDADQGRGGGSMKDAARGRCAPHVHTDADDGRGGGTARCWG
jgi:RecA-family ATPase